MNILHVISSAGVYGAETMIVQLSNRLQQRGHRILIGTFVNSHCANSDFLRYAQHHGLQTVSILCHGRADRSVIHTIRDIATRERIDVVHAHGYKADVYCYLALRKRGIGMVSTCHTWYDNTLALRLYGHIDRFVLRKFDRVIAVTDAVASVARSGGIAQEKISVIDNGLDTGSFQTLQPILRVDHPERRHFVGIIGRLAREKGIDIFLRAAALVKQEIDDCQFVIVGDGPDQEKLQQLCREVGLQSWVSFLGVRRDMNNIYASLDIQVSASLKEGLPMVLLEGLAAGKPIIATPTGAVERVIINEHTGLLVPPGDPRALADAIIRLLRNPALAKQLASAGRKLLATRFSAERMASDYQQVYSGLVGTKSAPLQDAMSSRI